MEDDYQITLKGKIKILFQLEKWQDVIKLSEQFNEKYGKDVEVDIMRFKSERRLSKSAPETENKGRISIPESHTHEKPESMAVSDIDSEKEQPLLLTAEHEEVQHPAMLVINEINDPGEPRLVEEKLVDEPFELIITDPFAEDKPTFSQAPNESTPDMNGLIVTDPFSEDKPAFSQVPSEPSADANGLIITDPFAANEPIFNLASNEPPVILTDSTEAENVPIQIEPEKEEVALVEENPGELLNTKITLDFKSNPVTAFDAEPALTSASQEPMTAQINAEENKSPAESWVPSSVVTDKSAEAWREVAAAADSDGAAKKHQPFSELHNSHSNKIMAHKKIAFNFKYVLILVLPLLAAVFLWLALSGKLNFNGGAAEKANPVSMVEPPVPVTKKPVPKVTPAAVIPRIDEKEKLVNERIKQANDFIKSGDILNALTVVLEAKKIKMTEPLRLLEEQITKKIREDESLAAEQKEPVQSELQSEDQAFAKAETENTMESWQNFLKLYPQGEFVARARNRIVVLEKKAAQKSEQELLLKIQQMQKLKLRSDYMDMNQAELNTVLRQLGKPIVQFEQFEHGGEKVIIDFSSGLMWTLWNKPMGFEKAKWWANRIYAGYAGWRLPTVEESLTLVQMAASLYAGLEDFAVWTGDGVSDKSRSVWTLRIPQGQFVPEDYGQVYYVWAVRKVGK